MMWKPVGLTALVILVATVSVDATEPRYKGCYDDELGAWVDMQTDLECSVSFSWNVVADCGQSYCGTFSDGCSISGTGLLGCTVYTHDGREISCGPTQGGCRTGSFHVKYEGWTGSFSGTTRCESEIPLHSGMVTLGCEAEAF